MMVKKNEPSIRKVMLRNFKSVVDQQEVEFGFLTLLMGENSSGKSSILQVLRLLQQSLKSEAIGRFPLNGRHIRVGTIEGIQNDKESNVFFGVEMGGYDWTINWEIEINDAVADAPSFTNIKKLDLGVRGFPRDSKLNSTLSAERDEDNHSNIIDIEYRVDVDEESRTETITSLGRHWQDVKADIGLTGTLSLLIEESEPKRIPITGLILKGSVPASVTVEREAKRVFAEVCLNSIIELNEGKRRSDKYKEEQGLSISDKKPRIRDKAKLVCYAVSRISDSLDNGEKFSYEELLRSLSKEERKEWLLEEELFKNIKNIESVRKDIIEEISKEISKIKTLDDKKEHVLYSYGGARQEWFRLINHFDIRYLGPLRKAPRLLMPAFAEDNIGEKGEYMAAVLAHQGKSQRMYPVPNIEPELDTYSVKAQYSIEDVSLTDAIERWGDRLNLLGKVVPKDMEAFGIGLEITPTNSSSLQLPLPAVGVGVSQLLPVLVCCLLAKQGDIILLEQPELHIHPALQQHLADFLICMSRSGRQLIVETHSEYILSRLRRRIVEESDDEVMNLVKVIFAERDQSGTKYRPLNFTRYGNLEEWPEGFFDQATEDEREIIKGAVKKWEERKASELPEGS